MIKNPDTQRIISYLRQKHKNTILASDISNIDSLKINLKNILLEELNITDSIWKSNRQYIYSYIRALLTIEYLKVKKEDIYNSLFKCKSKNEVISLITGKLPQEFSSSNNVCKYIISEIKFLKKNPNSTQEQSIDCDDINYNPSESDDNIENPQNSGQTLEYINSSSNLNINSIETISKEKTSITSKDLDKLIKSDKELLNKLLTISDSEIEKTILEEFKDNHKISAEIIKEWLNTYKKQTPIILEESKPIKKLAILKESASEEIKNLHSKINDLYYEISNYQEENGNLKLQLEDVNKQLENYKYKTPNLSSEHVFSVELKQLNSMLNSNSSESEIIVKDEILNRISQYIDKYSLLKVSDIIEKNRDIKSEIVQIILLAFLHEKSLL